MVGVQLLLKKMNNRINARFSTSGLCNFVAVSFLCSLYTAFAIFTICDNKMFLVGQCNSDFVQKDAKKHGEGEKKRRIILILQKFTGEDKVFCSPCIFYFH